MTTTTTLGPRAVLQRVVALVEQRAARSGGQPWDYLNARLYQELKAAAAPRPRRPRREARRRKARRP